MLLPAPFSPMSASTSPARAVSETSRSAVTPAKRLPIPRISSNGVEAPAPLEDSGSVTDGTDRYERLSSASFALKPATLVLSMRSTPVSMLLLGGIAALAASPLVASSCIHLEAR